MTHKQNLKMSNQNKRPATSDDESSGEPRKKISKLEVRCGEWDVRHENERVIHQNRKISEVTIHPFYTGQPDGKRSFSDVLHYNFALLHLEQDFCFNKHISHVCLPDLPNIKTGRPCN